MAGTATSEPLIGIIADDLTGATDVGSALVKGGMRVAQFTGVPTREHETAELDAIIIALKSRSIPADQAMEQSLDALRWLRSRGIGRFLFKYCSTFDSTDQGNIGPVSGALLDELGARQTIFCPAFPTNLRTVYQGHLFVGDRLLSESSMFNHPITPMRDPDLVRCLGRQADRPVGLLSWQVVRQGASAVRDALHGTAEPFVVCDAVTDDDLGALAEACIDYPLLTGGAGIAQALPAVFRQAGLLPHASKALPSAEADGPAAIVSGSCSEATLQQIAEFESRGGEVLRIDPLAADDGKLRETARQWAAKRLGSQPILIASSADPATVAAVQSVSGREAAAQRLEGLLGSIAADLVSAGVKRLVVAGGETSGAVIKALGVSGLLIGQEISPGVPWTVTIDEPRLALALKSGNFGGPEFFSRAFAVQP